MSATLLLTRPSLLADMGRPYQVVLDGKAVGEIRNNSSADLPVVAGTHTLQVRLLTLVSRRPGRRSPVVTFDVDDGEATGFECRAPSYPRTSYWWIVCLLGRPDQWIRLEEFR